MKNLSANAGVARHRDSIPVSRRFPRVGNGKLLLYYCLGKPMDRGGWLVTVHGVENGRIDLNIHTHTYIHTNL